MTVPSDTPRKAAIWSHWRGWSPFSWKVRSPMAVSATSAPRSPVTMVVRSLNGVSQFTIWLTRIPSASVPEATIMSSCSLPERAVVMALMVA